LEITHDDNFGFNLNTEMSLAAKERKDRKTEPCALFLEVECPSFW
jgi:hypothetical protein